MERRRIAPPPEPEATPQPKAPAARRTIYLCLRRKVLRVPPIRHRGERNDAGFSVFEFVVAAACALLARAHVAAARHAAGMRSGLEEIQNTRRSPGRGMNYGTMNYQFRLAGKDGYQRGVALFDYGRPWVALKVETSKSHLLRTAGVSRTGPQLRMLDDVLRRLQQRVADLPPVLLDAEILRDGTLRLSVNKWWVTSRRYGRAAWPLPHAGATVLALYLMLAGFNFRSQWSIRTDVLYRRLGISSNRPAHAARALDRALKLVNQHLKKLNANGELTGAQMSDTFSVMPIRGGGRVRFVVAEVEAEDRDEIEERREREEMRIKLEEEERRERQSKRAGELAEKLRRSR